MEAIRFNPLEIGSTLQMTPPGGSDTTVPLFSFNPLEIGSTLQMHKRCSYAGVCGLAVSIP